MTISRGQAILLIIAAALSGAAVAWLLFGWLQGIAFASSDVSRLWWWSLWTSETTHPGAGGVTVTTVYEPYALGRNLTLIGFGALASIFIAIRLMDRFGGGGGSSQEPADRLDKVTTAQQQLDGEMGKMLALVRSQAETGHRYSEALTKGQLNLEASHSREQMRAAINFLVGENQKAIHNSKDYERRLEESRAQIENLRAALMETREQSARDALTGVYARGHFDKTLATAVEDAIRNRASLSRSCPSAASCSVTSVLVPNQRRMRPSSARTGTARPACQR